MAYRLSSDYPAHHASGLASALEGWTWKARAAIANGAARDTQADSAGFAPGNARSIDATLLEYRNGVSRLLRNAVRDSTQVPALCSLPARALEQICRNLSLRDRLTLSSISRNLRVLLLSTPQVWSELIFLARGRWSPADLSDWAQNLLRRSQQEPLTLKMEVFADYMSIIWKELACNMHRIVSLTLCLECPCSTEDLTSQVPDFWYAALQALSESAPRLRRAHIVVTEPSLSESNDETGARDVAHVPLPLAFSALSQLGPAFQALSLSGVRLLPEPLSGVSFRTVTCFWLYRNNPIFVDELACIMTMMPMLVTLSLSAPSFDGSTDDLRTAGTARAPTKLRNLIISGTVRDLPQFCGVIPFAGIRNLDLDTVFNGAELVGAAYTPESIAQASITWQGVTIVVNGSAAITVVRSYRLWGGFQVLLSGCSNLTSIAVHEFRWFDDSWTILPPFPALTLLCIQLATCLEYASFLYQWPGNHMVGIFNISPGAHQWHLPNLQHLHVSAPRVTGPTCGYEACLGRCSPLMSVSLRDIVRFVRLKLVLGVPQIASVRFTGLRFVDHDLDVAFDELSSLAKSFELVQTPEQVPHMDMPVFPDYDP